jgi:hypothetical protein
MKRLLKSQTLGPVSKGVGSLALLPGANHESQLFILTSSKAFGENFFAPLPRQVALNPQHAKKRIFKTAAGLTYPVSHSRLDTICWKKRGTIL